MFLLVSCSYVFQHLLCFVQGRANERKQKKQTTKKRTWPSAQPALSITYEGVSGMNYSKCRLIIHMVHYTPTNYPIDQRETVYLLSMRELSATVLAETTLTCQTGFKPTKRFQLSIFCVDRKKIGSLSRITVSSSKHINVQMFRGTVSLLLRKSIRTVSFYEKNLFSNQNSQSTMYKMCPGLLNVHWGSYLILNKGKRTRESHDFKFTVPKGHKDIFRFFFFLPEQ